MCFLDLKFVIKNLEISTQGRGKQVMTQANFKNVCKFANIDSIGYFNGKEILLKCVKPKNEMYLFLY